MKNEMLQSEEGPRLCIVIMDWEELARGGRVIANYWQAIKNMNRAAELVSAYFHSSRVDESHIHCIGFSLGAHMCSILYKTYFARFGVKPGRITGLDPAGPFYQNRSISEKLHHSDAHLVDIIHTSDKFGLAESNGHMDFYPDKGPSEVTACRDLENRFNTYENVILYEESQKGSVESDFQNVTLSDAEIESAGGLKNLTVKSVLTYGLGALVQAVANYLDKKPKRVFTKFHQFFGCSHLMSVRLFLNSINDCEFKCRLCDTFEDFQDESVYNCRADPKGGVEPRMGYYADRATEFYKRSLGDFFLRTTEHPPFCVDPIKANNN
jgi:hypothetical protein